eukprot:Tbor_TRINITY_DN5788_c4_g1::TRINITY_DN5788_c4_g1_i1::g.20631::m.20631
MSDTMIYNDGDNYGLVGDFTPYRGEYDEDSGDNEMEVAHYYPRERTSNVRGDDRSYDSISDMYGGSFADTLSSMNIGDNLTPDLVPLKRTSHTAVVQPDPPPLAKYASEIPYSERYYRNMIIDEEKEVFTEVISTDLLLFQISDSIQQIQLAEEKWRNRIDISEFEELNHYILRPFTNYFLRLIQSGNPVSLIGSLMEKIRHRQLEMQRHGETFLSMTSPLGLIAAEIRKFRSSTNMFPHGSEPISRALIMYHEKLRRYDCAFMFVSCNFTWEEEWSRLRIELCRGFAVKSFHRLFSDVILIEQSQWEELLYIAEPFLIDMKEHKNAVMLQKKRIENKKMWRTTLNEREKEYREFLMSNRDDFAIFTKEKKLNIIHEMQESHISMAIKAFDEAVQGNIGGAKTSPQIEPFILLLEGGSLLGELSKTCADPVLEADREFDEIYRRESGNENLSTPTSLSRHVISRAPPKDIIGLLTLRYRNDMTYLSDPSVPTTLLDHYYCQLQALDRRLRDVKSDYYTPIEAKIKHMIESFKKKECSPHEEHRHILNKVSMLTSPSIASQLGNIGDISMEQRGTYEHSVHYQELLNKRKHAMEQSSYHSDPLFVRNAHMGDNDRHGNDGTPSEYTSHLSTLAIMGSQERQPTAGQYHFNPTSNVDRSFSKLKHSLETRIRPRNKKQSHVTSKVTDPSPPGVSSSQYQKSMGADCPQTMSWHTMTSTCGNGTVYNSPYPQQLRHSHSTSTSFMSPKDVRISEINNNSIPDSQQQEGKIIRNHNNINRSIKRDISVSSSLTGGPLKVKLPGCYC